MNAPVRLHSISQALADAFRQANDVQRRRATLVACQIAVSQTGLGGEQIDACFKVLHEGGDGTALRPQVERLSADIDNEYFRLSEGRDHLSKTKSLSQFRKARAAAALGFALSCDTEQLHEAIYEAIVAADDREKIVESVGPALLGK